VQHSKRLAGALGLLQQAVPETPGQTVEPLVEAYLRLLQSAGKFRLRCRQPLGYLGQPTNLRGCFTARPLAAQHRQHQRRQRGQRHQRRDGGPERPGRRRHPGEQIVHVGGLHDRRRRRKLPRDPDSRKE
jgi:hypothetical protein